MLLIMGLLTQLEEQFSTMQRQLLLYLNGLRYYRKLDDRLKLNKRRDVKGWPRGRRGLEKWLDV